MLSPRPAIRPLFSPQKQRESHRSDHTAKNRIWFTGQPPAADVPELFSNIDGGSIFQFTIVNDGRWPWKLVVTRRGGVDATVDVWDVHHLLCGSLDPSVTLVVSGTELARAVRQLFRMALRCQTRIPVGHRHMISPAAVEALGAAEALAGGNGR